jgi:hypothetical protein
MLIRGVHFMGDCSMKKLTLAFLLLQTSLLLGASDKPNPADFIVKVHVVSSASLPYVVGGYQVLETVIDNQPVELRASNPGLLALGDYSARVSSSVHGPGKRNSYDIYRGYDLLMPDGTTRTYAVTRLGPAPSNP